MYYMIHVHCATVLDLPRPDLRCAFFFLRWELTNTVHFTMGKPWLWATTISGNAHITHDITPDFVRCAWNLICQEESDWRQNDWNEWNEWKKDDWWNGWWSGWHDRSWKEETQTPLEEADRRKWEIQEEIEVRWTNASNDVTVWWIKTSHLNVGVGCSCRSKHFLHHQAMEPVKILGESWEAGTKGGTKATARDETRGQTSCREGAEGERTPGDFPKCLKMKTPGFPEFPRFSQPENKQ